MAGDQGEVPHGAAPRPLHLRILRTVAIWVGLAVFTLVFAEVFLRIAVNEPIMPRYVTGAPWGVRRNIPGADFHQITPEVNIAIHINRQGLRDDREFFPARPAGTCRIALFGDSYFEGFELNLKDTYAYRLEQALGEKGFNVEILNFAVSGFGTTEEERTYTGYARTFDPNLVLMEWNFSDYDDNVRSGIYKIADGKLVLAHPTYLPSIREQDRLMRSPIYRFFADNSQLYSYARENLARYSKRLLKVASAREAGDDADAAAFNAANGHAASPYALQLSQAVLAKFRDEAAADHHGFYVLEVPRPASRTQNVASIDQMDPALLKSVNLIQPTPALNAAGRPDQKLFYEHGAHHLTPIGVGVILANSIDRIAAAPELSGCRK